MLKEEEVQVMLAQAKADLAKQKSIMRTYTEASPIYQAAVKVYNLIVERIQVLESILK